MKTILNHRTIRKYKSEPIQDETLKEILQAGIRASNTGNMQAYSIIVTKDETIKKQLWEAHFKQDMVLQAPVHLTFCADFNRFSKWCNQREAIPGYNNFLSFFSAAIDALLVAQNIALAAEYNNLGICYLGTTTYNADKIIEILKLPKLVVPVTSIVVGRVDETPELTDRLPLDGVIHNETYHDYTKQMIDEIYSEKETLKENLKFLQINNKKTLAQIFTEIRYKKEDNLFFSKKLLDVLKKQGFMDDK